MNFLTSPPTERRILVFLLLSVALLAAPHAFHMPPLLFLFFFATAAWRFAAIWKKSLLPGTGLLFSCTLASIALLISQSPGVLGRDAGTNLFIVALGLKLLELRTERDLYLAVFLAFFVAATLFLYDQEMLMAVYILAVTCLLLTVLVSLNGRGARLIDNLKTAAVLIVQALPVMAVLFLFFPRIEAPRWLLFEEEKKAFTGLSDVLEPGAISRLGLSPEIAFRVKFEGAIPPPKERYWRGPVFTRTDGILWTQTEPGAHYGRTDGPARSGRPYTYTITQEHQEKNWVFALDLPGEVPAGLYMTSDYRLLAQKPLEERSAFRLTSYTRYNTGPITRQERRINLQLPKPPSPRVTELVESLNQPAAEETVEKAFAYFRENPFVYTLSPPPMPESPIETFLFETRRGFCGHYATAFVYLMRAAGIPARVVSGYQGGEYNPVGKFLEIRQANAHAWAEVWLEGKGWVRVDPTAAIAPERVEQGVNVDLQVATGEANFRTVDITSLGKLLKRARFAWHTIDYAWQRWVLNYNLASQSRLLSRLGIEGLKETALWLAAGIGLSTCLAALFIFRRKEAQTEEAVRLYRKFLAKLGKTGLEKSAGEGAFDFARRAIRAKPAAAPQILRVTHLYQKIRYGRSHTPADLVEMARQIGALRP